MKPPMFKNASPPLCGQKPLKISYTIDIYIGFSALLQNDTSHWLFSSLGKAVGGSPWITIIISLAICGGCLIGIFKFTQENRADKLWTPEDSIAQRHKEWVEKHFPAELRVSTVLLVAKDVLTPEVLREVSC